MNVNESSPTGVDVSEADKGQDAIPAAESGAPEMNVRGIDINRVPAEEMTKRLNGVGLGLAQTIVKNREMFGPFLTVHDLGRVPGIGPAAFVRITGQPWREDAHAKREKVMAIVGASNEGTISVQEIAKRFSDVEGFEGCLIVDSDGDMLASSWAAGSPEVIGAFAPYVIQKLAPMMQSLETGQCDMISIFISERAYTMIPFENLVFVAIHKMNKFNRKQLRIAQQVVAMLGRLLFTHKD
jgi:competence ComEA-like helix-hairpin-helix protein